MAKVQLVIWFEEDEGDEEFAKLTAIGDFVRNNWNDSAVEFEVEEV